MKAASGNRSGATLTLLVALLTTCLVYRTASQQEGEPDGTWIEVNCVPEKIDLEDENGPDHVDLVAHITEELSNVAVSFTIGGEYEDYVYTDDDGNATLPYTPEESGIYEVEVHADGYGDDSAQFTVLGRNTIRGRDEHTARNLANGAEKSDKSDRWAYDNPPEGNKCSQFVRDTYYEKTGRHLLDSHGEEPNADQLATERITGLTPPRTSSPQVGDIVAYTLGNGGTPGATGHTGIIGSDGLVYSAHRDSVYPQTIENYSENPPGVVFRSPTLR